MSFQIESISLENFRRFEAPITLANLGVGLNLITGPNGAGKSTFALGLRKLFFLYHRSKAASVVGEMVPWSAPGSSPRVSARFAIDGKTYVLTKQWMKGAFARLETPQSTLDGDEAEQAVAELLGFEAASRGETQWHGVPGLLWVEQGASPELGKRVEPAAGYLRDALGSAMGEVTSTDGDEVLASLEQALGELRRRGSESASKGPLAQTSAQLASSQEEIELLEAKLAQFRQRVDELALLHAACAADQRDKPWLRYQEQSDQTRKALQKLEALGVQAASHKAELQTLDAQISLLRAQGERGSQLRAAIKQRQADDIDANERLVAALARHEQAQSSVRQTRLMLDSTEQALERSRLVQRIEELQRRLVQLADDCLRQQARINQATACAERLRVFGESLVQYQVTDEALEQLRQWDQEIARLAGRAAAAATRLDFDLTDPVGVELDGKPVSTDQQATLLGTAVLTIPGIGRVQITPGGLELEDTERARGRLEKERQRLLLTLAVNSSNEASAQHEKRRQLQTDAQTERIRLGDFAPDGLDQLAEQLRSSQHEQEQVQRELTQLQLEAGGNAGGHVDLSATIDPTAAETTQAQWQKAVTDERQAGDTVAQARIRVEHTGQEVAVAQQSLEQWELARAAASEVGTADATEDLEQQLIRLDGERARLRRTLADLEQSIAAGNPDTLILDLRRFTDSAEQSREQAQAREARRDLLAAQLSEAGAGGLDESLQQALARHQRLARREAALRVRADALAWLVSQISARRQALTDRLQAPLRDRMNHYLKTLLPGVSLNLGVDLLPDSLTPDHQRTAGLVALQQEPVAEQSFGTREQLSLLARLAYADLLAQAGRATFLLVDDGLLNADDYRLEQIKRMLYDAGQRHQILIFSCHPDRWSGLGVAARELSGNGLIE